jgi:integrase
MLRAIDINMSGDVWTYTPAKHKTAHRGHTRTIFIGPKGQAVIRPFLRGRPVDAFLFSPREAEAERREKMHAKRRESGTRLSCGNVPGSNRRAKPKRQPGECYDVASYRRAIDRACDLADASAKGGRIMGDDERLVRHWHPHQLRHNAGTLIRREFGLEASKIILGHRSIDTTEIYAEPDQAKAQEAMRRIG